MELYKAICDFAPAKCQEAYNILGFVKGETFEIIRNTNKNGNATEESGDAVNEWWGARSMKNNAVGYVPSKYFKYEERRIGIMASDSNQVEQDMKKISNSVPENLPVSPAPDYDVTTNKSDVDLPEVVPEPAPDYLDDNDTTDGKENDGILAPSKINRTAIPLIRSASEQEDYDGLLRPNDTTEGLILPKKLANPCVDSKERQALHKELLLNKRRGFNILSKKSELDKKLEERDEGRRKKEREEYNRSKRTSLEIVLEKRAQKIKQEEKTIKLKSIEEASKTKVDIEFQEMRAKIMARSGSISDNL